MSAIYERNIESLKKRYPAYADKINASKDRNYPLESGIAPVEDRDVLYTVFNGRQYQLDSLYESEGILNVWYSHFKNDELFNVFTLFGLGNGMFVRKILKENKAEQDIKIIVYEPDMSILKTVLENIDISDIIGNEDVNLYIREIADEPFGEVLDRIINYKNIKNVRNAVYPNYTLFFENDLKNYSNSIKINKEAVKGSMDANEKFGKAFYNNIFDNIHKYLDSKSLISLKEKYPKEVPVIIVSSGPSLNKNIGDLKEAVGKALIVAVDSAMPILLHEEIVPDLYASIDGMKFLEHFKDEKTKEIPILTALSATPGAVRDGQTAFFEKGINDYINAFLEKEGIDAPVLSTGGTVANTAYAFAEFLGAKSIILCGQDLAYTGDKAHADHALSDNNSIVQDSLRLTKDIYGNEVKTSVEFMLYKDWFEREIKKNGVRTIDATEGGARIEGTEIMTLKDAIASECTKAFDAAGCIGECAPLFDAPVKERMLEYLKDIPERLDNLLTDVRKSLRNYDRMRSMAESGNLEKGELTSLLRDNDEISARMNKEPVMSMVEYLIQDSIRKLSESANKTSNDVRQEIIDASRVGSDHAKAVIEKAEWIISDIRERI